MRGVAARVAHLNRVNWALCDSCTACRAQRRAPAAPHPTTRSPPAPPAPPARIPTPAPLQVAAACLRGWALLATALPDSVLAVRRGLYLDDLASPLDRPDPAVRVAAAEAGAPPPPARRAPPTHILARRVPAGSTWRRAGRPAGRRLQR